MKRIFLLLFVPASLVSHAANYIDNPNFNLDLVGWIRVADLERPNAFGKDELVEFVESTPFNGQRNCDQYLHLSNAIAYQMERIPKENPLYFSVELGYDGSGESGAVEISLIEMPAGSPLLDDWPTSDGKTSKQIQLPPDSSLVNPEYGSFVAQITSSHGEPTVGYFPAARRLGNPKKVYLSNRNMWSAVVADFPAYKNSSDTILYLLIQHRCSDGLHVNYAQVGTDLLMLGGRGTRSRDIE